MSLKVYSTDKSVVYACLLPCPASLLSRPPHVFARRGGKEGSEGREGREGRWWLESRKEGKKTPVRGYPHLGQPRALAGSRKSPACRNLHARDLLRWDHERHVPGFNISAPPHKHTYTEQDFLGSCKRFQGQFYACSGV